MVLFTTNQFNVSAEYSMMLLNIATALYLGKTLFSSYREYEKDLADSGQKKVGWRKSSGETKNEFHARQRAEGWVDNRLLFKALFFSLLLANQVGIVFSTAEHMSTGSKNWVLWALTSAFVFCFLVSRIANKRRGRLFWIVDKVGLSVAFFAGIGLGWAEDMGILWD